MYTHVDVNGGIPLETSNTQTETLKCILWSLCRNMLKVRLFAENASAHILVLFPVALGNRTLSADPREKSNMQTVYANPMQNPSAD